MGEDSGEQILGEPGGSEPSALTGIPSPGQLDLGEVIAALEAQDPAKVLPVGFYGPHSYRGYYHELAFEMCTNVTVGEILAAARSAVGKTFEGWKGGDYTMDTSSLVHLVQEEGCCGETLGAVSLHLMLNQAASPSAASKEENP